MAFQLKIKLIFCLTFSYLYCIYCYRCLHYNVLIPEFLMKINENMKASDSYKIQVKHRVHRHTEADGSEAGVPFGCCIIRVGDIAPTQ
jgi:hypothetical protein